VTYQLVNAKVWDGTAWVLAAGGAAAGISWPSPVVDGSSRVVVAADATPHTMGAWTELIAATSEDAGYVVIRVTDSFLNATDTSSLYDVGIGASGSEQTLIESLPAGFTQTDSVAQTGGVHHVVPAFVPAGTRVSVRMQSVIGSHTATFEVQVAKPTVGVPVAVDTLGANRATSQGTQIFSGVTGAVSNWVEIATTAVDYQAVALVPAPGGSVMANLSFSYDLATGTAGNEVRVASLNISTSTNENYGYRGLPVLHVADVPSGTRLSMRTTNNRSYQYGILVGVPYP
jgi:hypothetical protein